MIEVLNRRAEAFRNRHLGSETFWWWVLILVAAGLRLAQLDSESLWNDELSSWRRSDVGSLGEVISIARQDVHPPGYQLFLYYWIKIFGDSAAMLRLPSVIAGIWSVVFMYAFARRFYSIRVAFLSAFILAVSWTPIYYSQEARAYCFLALGSIATSYYWLKLFVESRCSGEEASRADVLSFAFWCLATSYVHYFGVLLVSLLLSGGCIIGTRYRTLLMPSLLVSAIVALAFAPWISALLAHTGKSLGHMDAPTISSGVKELLDFALYPLEPNGWIAGVVFLAFLVLAAVRKTPSAGSQLGGFPLQRDIYLLCWVVLPVSGAFVISHTLTPVWNERNLIIVLPPIYLMLAVVVFSIPNRILATLAAVLVSLAIAFGTFGEEGYYKTLKKRQTREALEFTCLNYGGETVIYYASSPRYLQYYSTNCRVGENLVGRLGKAADIEGFEKLVADRKLDQFWYVTIHRKPEREFSQHLEANYTELLSKEFKGARATLFQVK